MKHVLRSLPITLFATAAAAHEAPNLHHHLTDPSWMPLAAGLLAIGCAAAIAWRRK
ncbi:hypothetical protein [Sulfitobacter sp.]|uniref:hypothetical protein n=1 Tax=Sulfitobacter sp. TaxID=1903071 RepID=UPI003EF5D70E